MATPQQLAQYCADHFPAHTLVPHLNIFGVPSLTSIIASIVSLAIGFGLGWYVKGRGMAGVQIDINNIKTDVLNLKNKIDPSAPAPVSATVAA